MSELTNACCTLPPAVAEYTPVGETVASPAGNGQTMYVVGEKGKPGVVVVYDIFGYHDSTKQTADLLASLGFRVCMPDFFRGHPWTAVPVVVSELMVHIGKHAPWESIREDIGSAVGWLTAEGAPAVVGVGFCWGGLMALKALSDPRLGLRAVASPHPSFVNVETVKDVTGPVLLLPSNDEADMVPVIESLRGKPFGKDCAHKRFPDMHHGWCAARADFTNPLNAKRTSEAVEDIANFFKKVLA